MIKFGTSGFRGIFADNFTKENVQKVAYAITKVYPNKKDVVTMGYDNRFMGQHFAIWMAEVFAAYGYKINFYNVSVPSTLVAYHTKNKDFGVHLTASHNPYYYNGIKIFMRGARETTSDINQKLEEISNSVDMADVKTKDFNQAVAEKQIKLTQNIKPYCNSILRFINLDKLKNNNLKVLFNNMNGSSSQCAKYILEKMGVEYKIHRANVDPYFQHKIPAPYVHNLSDQTKILKAEKFDIGVAVDGDGDRVTFIDSDGTPYDCNYMSAVVYYYLLEYKNKGNAVKNCALSELIPLLAKKYNCKTFDAKVGFKNIADIMQKDKKSIIGIETNGMALKGHILHKDGLLNLALIVEILAVMQKNIKQILNHIKKITNYPCHEMEFAYPITDAKKAEINKLVFEDKKTPKTPNQIKFTSYADGAKFVFENGYWGVIRFSGNENVVRIFSEMQDKKTCAEYIKIYEDFIGVKERQV